MCEFCDNPYKRIKDTMLVKKDGFHISTHIPSVWVKDIYYCPYCGKKLPQEPVYEIPYAVGGKEHSYAMKVCGNCRYHDPLTGKCLQKESEYFGDIRQWQYTCWKWVNGLEEVQKL